MSNCERRNLLVRVPVVVRRPRAAAEAHGFLPLLLARRTAAARLERVPDVPAARIAAPAVVLARFPAALRTADSAAVTRRDERIVLGDDQAEEHASIGWAAY